jgi:hypothetical protein
LSLTHAWSEVSGFQADFPDCGRLPSDIRLIIAACRAFLNWRYRGEKQPISMTARRIRQHGTSVDRGFSATLLSAWEKVTELRKFCEAPNRARCARRGDTIDEPLAISHRRRTDDAVLPLHSKMSWQVPVADLAQPAQMPVRICFGFHEETQ